MGTKRLTSGKVPLEKTLATDGSQYKMLDGQTAAGSAGEEDSHEKTSLAAGAIANNDELATDLGRHDERLLRG
jgi:hypothetical protein